MTYLVADIGGTNARFARCSNQGDVDIASIRTYVCRHYEDITSLITHYIHSQASTSHTFKIRAACFAVAAPIMDDEVCFINNAWRFSIETIKLHCDIHTLFVINDFDAIAWSLPYIHNLYQIGTQHPVTNMPKVILGPGTGFGNALYLPHSKSVVSTQGGHSGFSPSDHIELEIFSWALQQGINISRENFVSGMGLQNIYAALCDISGVAISPLSPDEITHQAVSAWQNKTLPPYDNICYQAFNTFLSFLGNIAGDQAVSSGATGGVYIAGGIAPRFTDIITQSKFRQRFEDKGVMSPYVRTIPSYIITEKHPGLIGAAHIIQKHLAH